MEVSGEGSEVERTVRDYVGIYSSKALLIKIGVRTGVGNRLNSWSFMRERWIQPCMYRPSVRGFS